MEVDNLESKPKTFDIDEARAENYATLIKSLNIKCKRFVHVKKNGKIDEFTEYPLKWTYPCYGCLEKYDTIPVFRVHEWDEDLNLPIFKLTEVFCSLSCYREYLIYSSDNAQSIELQSIARFAERYLNIDSRDLNFIPKYFRKDLNPWGTMTREEWMIKRHSIYAFAVHPPMYVVETFIIENDRKKEDISNRYVLNTNVTAAMQNNYLELLSKV